MRYGDSASRLSPQTLESFRFGVRSLSGIPRQPVGARTTGLSKVRPLSYRRRGSLHRRFGVRTCLVSGRGVSRIGEDPPSRLSRSYAGGGTQCLEKSTFLKRKRVLSKSLGSVLGSRVSSHSTTSALKGLGAGQAAEPFSVVKDVGRDGYVTRDPTPQPQGGRGRPSHKIP